MIALTKADLRDLHALVTAHQPPGRPVSLEEVVRAGELASKLTTMVAEHRAVEERGALVLEWRVPREWTTVKSGKGMRPWILETIKRALADDLRKVLPAWPKADLFAAKRRRWVQVRRFSDQEPDRPTCPDCLGSRQQIDLLKGAGIIVDDSPTWTVDDTAWIKCKRGMTHNIVRVFEVATFGGRAYPEPECLPPPRPVKKQGAMVKAIAGGAA